jgi:hypothetical protein
MFQTDRIGSHQHDAPRLFDRHVYYFRNFVDAWLPTLPLVEHTRSTAKPRQRVDHVNWNPNSSRLFGNRTGNRLANPPNGVGRKLEAAEWESGKLDEIVRSRLKQSRAVLGGLVSEQMAPLLPGFPFDPGDCRFIGKPVDFIVFKGMNSQNISEVIFLEVKSGKAKSLNPQEKKLR